MKTLALLAKYKRGDDPEPDVLWKRLVWMAAKLVASAEDERHTRRKPNTRRKDDRQMELFDNPKREKGGDSDGQAR